MEAFIDKIIELTREITTLRLENKRLKEECERYKEMDETFIATLDNISQVCDKTTSGNVSHNIATIKCRCREMLQFYNKYKV
jgi:hypothetical protein|nr:MAG TPA: hypothetical protein [Bacteriophage sp.]